MPISNNTLRQSAKLARISETLHNYQQSDIFKGVETKVMDRDHHLRHINNEEEFWTGFFNEPEQYWGSWFRINQCAISFWTARVPGLFFTRTGKSIRNEGFQLREDNRTRQNILQPLGKSGVVMGGVGTFVLPPDNNGSQLATLTFSCNASAGIPILLTNDILHALHLSEGHVIRIKRAQWVRMQIDWVRWFPSLKEIKRGYFRIDSVNDIEIVDEHIPIEVHPFSIMEYETRNSLLYDYVFVTAYSSDPSFRHQASDFFERYRIDKNRNGRYLIPADSLNPLFDSIYPDPKALRSDHNGLRLIKHRINELLSGKPTLDELMNQFAGRYQRLDEIQSLVIHLDVPPAIISGSRPADMIIDILNYCVEHDKVDELADLLLK